MRRWLRDRWRASPDGCLLVLYAVLAAAFFAPLLGGGQTLYFDDTNHFYYPARHLIFSTYRTGLVPLWTTRIGAGYPILAEGQGGGLYPGNVLFLLLPRTDLALSWTVFLHGWLAAALTHGFLRRLGVRPAAAAVGAVAFQFSGAFIGHLVYVSMACSLVWLPGACWGIESGFRRRSLRGFTLAGVALALAFTAVHVQMAVYVALTAGAYGLLRWLGSPGRRLIGLLGLAWMAVLSGWLAMVQLLPMLELAALSPRAESLAPSSLTQYALTPMWLLYLFMPHVFGHPTAGPTQWANLTVPWELNAYLGIPATVLALAAPALSRRKATWGLALLWWATFLLAWGRALPLFELLHSLPVLEAFRIPARWLVPGSFAGAALAGLALDACLRDPATSRRRLAKLLPLLGLTCIAVLALAWLAVDVNRRSGRIAGRETLHAALCAGWFLALWVATVGLLLQGGGRPRLAAALTGLLVVDLFVVQRTFNPVAPPTVFSPSEEPVTDGSAVRVAAAMEPEERILIPPWDMAHPFLKPLTYLLVGVAGVDNYLPLQPAVVASLLDSWKQDLEAQATASRRAQWLLAARQGMARLDRDAAARRELWLRRLRVRVTLPRYGPVGAVGDDDGLYWLDGPLAPQAWAPAMVVPAGPAGARAEVEQFRAPPAELAVVSGAAELPPTAGWPGPLAHQRVTGARELVGQVGPGLAVVDGVAYPGWRAYRPDGGELPMAVVDGLFRAAVVRQESPRLTFVFRPLTFRLGLFLTLLALAALAAGARLP